MIRIKLIGTVISVILLISTSLAMHAQEAAVRGRVLDQDNNPLPGAAVTVKGTHNGVTTDPDGNYEIKVRPDAVLTAQFIGYSEQEITVGKQSVINFVLSLDNNYLEEVVVVGYGVQKKVNMTGSVSTVNYEEAMKSRPIQTTQQVLAGASAGVVVNQGSGKPGQEDITVRIRGIGTLNDSSPLVIVDGFESTMSAVNPDDIATISILKDAASCAIYGNRGANGVILITTKDGASKGKNTTSVTYSGMVSLNTPVDVYHAISNYADYMSVMNEAAENIGQADLFSQAMIDLWREKEKDPNGISESGYPNYVAYPNTDWFRAICRNAVLQKHNVTATGSTGRNSYLISASYLNNPGIMDKTGMRKYKLRANISSKLTDWLEIGTKLWGYLTDRDLCDIDGASDYMTRGIPGIYPYYDGKYGWMENPEQNTNSRNNLYFINRFDGEEKQHHINATLFANITLPLGIKSRTAFNYRYYNTKRRYWGDVCNAYSFRVGDWTYFYNDLSRPTQTAKHTDTFAWTLQSDLFWAKTIAGKHDISALAGFESMYYNTGYTEAQKKGWSNDQLRELNNMIDMKDIKGTEEDYASMSWYGRVTYAYDKRYLFEANLRYDGSSRFAPESRWGLFPSFSAGWRISQEPWMKDSGFDNLKLRASWGKLGNNAIDNYEYQSTYTSSITYPMGGGDILTSGMVSTLSNYALTWETTTSYDLGLEIAVLKNRLTLEADGYYRLTDGILYKAAIPATVGTKSAPYQNLCQVSNKGFEITLGWKDSIGDFHYGFEGNFTRNWNRVDKYKGRLDAGWKTDEFGHRYYDTNLGSVSTGTYNRVMEGKIINEFYNLDIYSGDGSHFYADGSVNPGGGPRDGMIRTPEDMDWLQAMIAAGNSFLPLKNIGKDGIWYGDMIYADLNGDGIYGNDDDFRFMGISKTPKFFYGFNINMEWKNFDFSAQFAGAGGYAIHLKYTAINSYGARADLSLPYEIAYDHYFYDPENPSDPRTNTTSKHGRITLNNGSEQNGGGAYSNSTHWLYRGDYLKIKNITLGYSLPYKIAAKARMQSFRVFLSGDNIWTFTKYPGMDPEIKEEKVFYPLMRQWTLGLSVTF